MFFSRTMVLNSYYRLSSWSSLYKKTSAWTPTPPTSTTTHTQIQFQLIGVTLEHSPPGDAKVQVGLRRTAYCAYKSLGDFVKAQILG